MELDENSSNSWGLFGNEGVRESGPAEGFKTSDNFTAPLEVMPDNILDSDEPHLLHHTASYSDDSNVEQSNRSPEESTFGGLEKETDNLQAEMLQGVGFQEGSAVDMWTDPTEPAYLGGGGGGEEKGAESTEESFAAGECTASQVNCVCGYSIQS